jgi:hypothetical protein
LHVRVTNPTANPVVVAYLEAGTAIEQRTLSTTAAKGEVFETEWRLAPATGALSALHMRHGTLVVGAGSGASPETAITPEHEEAQFSYRVDGELLEMLTPPRTFTARLVNGAVSVQRVSALRSLEVTVAPVPTP